MTIWISRETPLKTLKDSYWKFPTREPLEEFPSCEGLAWYSLLL